MACCVVRGAISFTNEQNCFRAEGKHERNPWRGGREPSGETKWSRRRRYAS